MSVKEGTELPAPLTLAEAMPEPVRVKEGAIAESGETYLETILLLKERVPSGLVRAVDIAKYLSFSKPSVSRALNQLKEYGLITIEPSGAILLTETGKDLAEKVVYRHRVLTYFLKHVLLVPDSVAEHDACRMEHVVSDQTLERIIEFLREKDLLPADLQEKEVK